VARQLLRRWGVLQRALLDRERLPVPWRDILRACRRLELRGEIRGGRFIAGLSGEQFALPEAVSMLRAGRNVEALALPALSASDPLSFSLLPGPSGLIVPRAAARARSAP
jgi:ATP-dependent Lhr-like helicase